MAILKYKARWGRARHSRSIFLLRSKRARITSLAKKVRSLRPQTKILYMTGYSGEFIQADMLTPGVSFIQKPFTSVDLERKIGKMLADKLRENSPDSTSSPKTISASKALAARTSR